jgi:hypothetical protein
MNGQLKEQFISKWEKYFSGAELPVVFYYTDDIAQADINDSKTGAQCLICNLNRVRDGHSFVYSSRTPGCSGGKRFTGFSQRLNPGIEHFLSCGIPGIMNGERYKKSSKLVKDFLKNLPPFKAPARYLVFKRWDKLSVEDEPAAVIFFAGTDVLSGLFTLANYDFTDANGVIAPFGSGCSSIISYPLEESRSDSPRCVLGMFDVSARPCVPAQTLTFTIPMKRFQQMFRNMDESFLITQSWDIVKKRISR